MIHVEASNDGEKAFSDRPHENSERIPPFSIACAFDQSDRALHQSGGKERVFGQSDRALQHRDGKCVRLTNQIAQFRNMCRVPDSDKRRPLDDSKKQSHWLYE